MASAQAWAASWSIAPSLARQMAGDVARRHAEAAAPRR